MTETPEEGNKTQTPSDQTKTDDKTGEETKETTQEFNYELSLSENSLLKEEDLNHVRDFAKSNNLSQEAAKSFLENQEKIVSDYHSSLEATHAKTVKGWEEEIKNDEHIGGDNFSKTEANIDRFLKAYGNEDLTKILDSTGYKHHPALVRAFNKAGAALSEDTLKKGPAMPPTTQKTPEEVFYGKKK